VKTLPYEKHKFTSYSELPSGVSLIFRQKLQHGYVFILYHTYVFKTVDASKELGLEVNIKKTKYMLLSRHQNTGQYHDLRIGNRCFENVAQFTCSVETQTS
jgi:hypothetical protein